MKRLYVPPYGNTGAKLAICGDQPSVIDVRSRKPFVGSDGKLLDECLNMTGILRHNIYLTNVIKDLDKPLSGYVSIGKNNKVDISNDGYQYIQELCEELSNLNLNVVVAMGDVALLALTNRININKWRASVIESTLIPGLKVVPTLHPITVVPPKMNYLNKPLICEDLIKAKHESEFKELLYKDRVLKTFPIFEEVMFHMEQCYEKGLEGNIISLDIEIIGKEIDCFSISYDDTFAMSIPLKYKNEDYFDMQQEISIVLALDKILSNENIAKVGANFIFDLQFIFRKYKIVPKGNIYCTQIAQKISLPDMPAGLDNVTRIYTDIPYYKEDGKKWMKMGVGTYDEWWRYNAMDSIVPSEAIYKQIEVLEKQNNIDTYNRQRKLIPILIYMSEHGIKIDVEGLSKQRDIELKKLHELEDNFKREVGYDINCNSTQQVANYFYNELKIPEYKNRKTGNVSTDIDALKRIVRKGYGAARILLDIRTISKRISTYLNTSKIDPDGRYRSSYNPVGAETGRLSSSKTIFGTGGNQQNWPHDLLKYFVADDGYLLYSIDLSQIENRIVAYTGKVVEQIKAFESGIDMHRLTASIIIGKNYNEISDEDGSSNIGDGRQSERYWGKKGNHATNYDVGYKTFALKNEMPENVSKAIIERIHSGFPEIRFVYQAMIENMLKKNRTVTNLMGRNRLFLGPVYPSYPNIPANACKDTFRQAYAHFPQSTVADKINEHGLNYIYYNQEEFRPIELLTQIHDSIVFQIPLATPLLEHARMVMKIKRSLEIPLHWGDTVIQTPADISIGFNMSKKGMTEFKHSKFTFSEQEFANELYQIVIKTKPELARNLR